MTPQKYFNNLLSTDSTCPIDVYSNKYDREDLFRFAESYFKSNQHTEEELREYLLNWHNGGTSFSIKDLMKWLYGREV